MAGSRHLPHDKRCAARNVNVLRAALGGRGDDEGGADVDSASIIAVRASAPRELFDSSMTLNAATPAALDAILSCAPLHEDFVATRLAERPPRLDLIEHVRRRHHTNGNAKGLAESALRAIRGDGTVLLRCCADAHNVFGELRRSIRINARRGRAFPMPFTDEAETERACLQLLDIVRSSDEASHELFRTPLGVEFLDALARTSGTPRCIKELTAAGVDPDGIVDNSVRHLPLGVAARSGRDDIVDTLLDAGAGACVEALRFALDFAGGARSKASDRVAALIHSRALLKTACAKGEYAFVADALRAAGYDDAEPATVAAATTDAEKVGGRGKATPTTLARDAGLLCSAARHGQSEVARLLIRAGAPLGASPRLYVCPQTKASVVPMYYRCTRAGVPLRDWRTRRVITRLERGVVIDGFLRKMTSRCDHDATALFTFVGGVLCECPQLTVRSGDNEGVDNEGTPSFVRLEAPPWLTPLAAAWAGDQFEIMDVLADLGASLVHTGGGETLTERAARENKPRVVRDNE